MLSKNYISFSCVKCKAEITIKKEFLMFNNCPECGLDSLKIKKLLDDMPSPAPTKITPILKNKEETLKEVEEYYSNRENTIIDEKYKYANLDEVYSNINYEIKELDLGVNVDKEDFNNLFKDVNHIYRDIISLKDFHKHNIENLENIIIMIFAKGDVTLFQISNQMSYYFDTQINKDTEIVFGIGEASTGDLERVELFYSKKINK